MHLSSCHWLIAMTTTPWRRGSNRRRGRGTWLRKTQRKNWRSSKERWRSVLPNSRYQISSLERKNPLWLIRVPSPRVSHSQCLSSLRKTLIPGISRDRDLHFVFLRDRFVCLLQTTSPQCQNLEQREAYQRLTETVSVLHRLATRLSSRAEIVGAVRQVQFYQHVQMTVETRDNAGLFRDRRCIVHIHSTSIER